LRKKNCTERTKQLIVVKIYEYTFPLTKQKFVPHFSRYSAGVWAGRSAF